MEPGPIRPVFRVLSGAIAVLLIIALALIAFSLSARTETASLTVLVWTFALAVTLAFAVRYFGFFAITGHPPKRAPRTPLRTFLDAAYGIVATFVILLCTSTLGGPLLIFTLVFLRAMRRYWERGAASVRPPAEPDAVSGR